MAEKRKRVDWDALEPHYRSGIRTLRDIGAEFGVSDPAIVKHAREKGWTRNLRAKIEARTRDKVSAAVISEEVSEGKKLTEHVRVEIESEVRARLELNQRRDSAELRVASMNMVREIGAVGENVDEIRQVGEMIAAGDDKRMAMLLERVLELPGRAKTLKDAAETAIKAIQLERQVNRMEDASNGAGGSYEEFLRSLA